MRHLRSLPGLKRGNMGDWRRKGVTRFLPCKLLSCSEERVRLSFLALSGDFGAFCLYARLEILKFLSSTYTRYSLCCIEEREIVVSSRDAKITKHAPCILTMTLKDDAVNRISFTTETFPT